MKCCSYCGKEYADDARVCLLDGQPVKEKKAAQPAAAEACATEACATEAWFSVKLISPILSAGTYQVFVERSDLVFIQVEGGSKSVLAAIAPLLGPMGLVILLIMWLFGRKKAREADDGLQDEIERPNPEDLLHENESNFKLNLAEIRDAAIEPSSVLATSGKAGRLVLTVRHGEKFKFEFADPAGMANAIRLLTPLLNATLRINVDWDSEKQQFQTKNQKDM